MQIAHLKNSKSRLIPNYCPPAFIIHGVEWIKGGEEDRRVPGLACRRAGFPLSFKEGWVPA